MKSLTEATRYTARNLKKLPTLSVGQADDLKIETKTRRVWLSRCSVEDGEPVNNKITIEELLLERWRVIDWYEG